MLIACNAPLHGKFMTDTIPQIINISSLKPLCVLHSNNKKEPECTSRLPLNRINILKYDSKSKLESKVNTFC